MTDQSIVTCLPATESPHIAAELIRCESCHVECWVSKTLYPRVLSRELTPICLDCTADVMKAGNHELTLHWSQLDELRAFGLLDFAHEVIDEFNKGPHAT